MEKTTGFRPSIKVTCSQLIAIVVILMSVISIPFLFTYLKNPERKSPKEIIENITNGIKNFTLPESFSLPITHTQIDISILQERPELLIYIGIGFIIIAFLIFLALARNALRGN